MERSTFGSSGIPGGLGSAAASPVGANEFSPGREPREPGEKEVQAPERRQMGTDESAFHPDPVLSPLRGLLFVASIPGARAPG